MGLRGHPSWPWPDATNPLTLPANFALKSWELGHPGVSRWATAGQRGVYCPRLSPGPQTLVSRLPDGHKDSAARPESLAGAPPG